MMSSADDIVIFDRDLIAKQRMRAKSNFADHDFLFIWSKEQLADRLLDINKNFSNILQLGSRGAFTRGDKPAKLGDNILTCDICPAPLNNIDDCGEYSYIQNSEEALSFSAQSMDLVISNLTLHSVNDLPGSLLQIRKILKDDGLFMAAMAGGKTLYELRDTFFKVEREMSIAHSPRIFPFADKLQIGELLTRSGFTLPVIDSEIVTVTYDNIFKLMADLRGMGEGNSLIKRSKTPLSKEFFMQLAKKYQELYSDNDGRVKASFEIIFLLGWTPDKSQQKPLAPGSAKKSLAEALKTIEIEII